MIEGLVINERSFDGVRAYLEYDKATYGAKDVMCDKRLDVFNELVSRGVIVAGAMTVPTQKMLIKEAD